MDSFDESDASEGSYGYLVFLTSKGERNLTYPLSEGKTTIGASEQVDVRLKLPPDTGLEDIHCFLVVNDAGLAIIENKSVDNPITVNDTEVRTKRVLKNEDILSIVGKRIQYLNEFLTEQDYENSSFSNKNTSRKSLRHSTKSAFKTKSSPPEKVLKRQSISVVAARRSTRTSYDKLKPISKLVSSKAPGQSLASRSRLSLRTSLSRITSTPKVSSPKTKPTNVNQQWEDLHEELDMTKEFAGSRKPRKSDKSRRSSMKVDKFEEKIPPEGYNSTLKVDDGNKIIRNGSRRSSIRKKSEIVGNLSLNSEFEPEYPSGRKSFRNKSLNHSVRSTRTLKTTPKKNESRNNSVASNRTVDGDVKDLSQKRVSSTRKSYNRSITAGEVQNASLRSTKNYSLGYGKADTTLSRLFSQRKSNVDEIIEDQVQEMDISEEFSSSDRSRETEDEFVLDENNVSPPTGRKSNKSLKIDDSVQVAPTKHNSTLNKNESIRSRSGRSSIKTKIVANLAINSESGPEYSSPERLSTSRKSLRNVTLNISNLQESSPTRESKSCNRSVNVSQRSINKSADDVEPLDDSLYEEFETSSSRRSRRTEESVLAESLNDSLSFSPIKHDSTATLGQDKNKSIQNGSRRFSSRKSVRNETNRSRRTDESVLDESLDNSNGIESNRSSLSLKIVDSDPEKVSPMKNNSTVVLDKDRSGRSSIRNKSANISLKFVQNDEYKPEDGLSSSKKSLQNRSGRAVLDESLNDSDDISPSNGIESNKSSSSVRIVDSDPLELDGRNKSDQNRSRRSSIRNKSANNISVRSAKNVESEMEDSSPDRLSTSRKSLRNETNKSGRDESLNASDISLIDGVESNKSLVKIVDSDSSTKHNSTVAPEKDDKNKSIQNRSRRSSIRNISANISLSSVQSELEDSSTKSLQNETNRSRRTNESLNSDPLELDTENKSIQNISRRSSIRNKSGNVSLRSMQNYEFESEDYSPDRLSSSRKSWQNGSRRTEESVLDESLNNSDDISPTDGIESNKSSVRIIDRDSPTKHNSTFAPEKDDKNKSIQNRSRISSIRNKSANIRSAQNDESELQDSSIKSSQNRTNRSNRADESLNGSVSGNNQSLSSVSIVNCDPPELDIKNKSIQNISRRSSIRNKSGNVSLRSTQNYESEPEDSSPDRLSSLRKSLQNGSRRTEESVLEESLNDLSPTDGIESNKSSSVKIIDTDSPTKHNSTVTSEHDQNESIQNRSRRSSIRNKSAHISLRSTSEPEDSSTADRLSSSMKSLQNETDESVLDESLNDSVFESNKSALIDSDPLDSKIQNRSRRSSIRNKSSNISLRSTQSELDSSIKSLPNRSASTINISDPEESSPVKVSSTRKSYSNVSQRSTRNYSLGSGGLSSPKEGGSVDGNSFEIIYLCDESSEDQSDWSTKTNPSRSASTKRSAWKDSSVDEEFPSPISKSDTTRSSIKSKSAAILDHTYSIRRTGESFENDTQEMDDIPSPIGPVTPDRSRRSSRSKKSTLQEDFDYSSYRFSNPSTLIDDCTVNDDLPLGKSLDEEKTRNSGFVSKRNKKTATLSIANLDATSKRSVIDLTSSPMVRRNTKSLPYQPVTEDITPVTPLSNSRKETGFKTPLNTPHLFENIRKSVLKSRSRLQHSSASSEDNSKKRRSETSISSRSSKKTRLTINEDGSFETSSSFGSFRSEDVFDVVPLKDVAPGTPKHIVALTAKPVLNNPVTRFSLDTVQKRPQSARKSLQITAFPSLDVGVTLSEETMESDSPKTTRVLTSSEDATPNFPSIKKLFATPKVMKSPKNDLTRIPNLRNIMSPKQQNSPKNDLSDVRGLKRLMRTPKQRKEPLNDLSDVAGLKKLLRTPKNQKEPLNDLSDFEGVADMFTNVHRLSNASDVENNQDLFNRVFDRRPLKTYRGKSLSPVKRIDAYGDVRKSIGDAPSVNPRIGDWIEEQAALRKRFDRGNAKKKGRVEELKTESRAEPSKQKRGKQAKEVEYEVQCPTVSSAANELQAEPLATTRNRRRQISNTEIEDALNEELTNSKTRTRSKKPVTEVVETSTSRSRKKIQTNDDSIDLTVKSTRGTKRGAKKITAEIEKSPPKTRGKRKAATQDSPKPKTTKEPQETGEEKETVLEVVKAPARSRRNVKVTNDELTVEEVVVETSAPKTRGKRNVATRDSPKPAKKPAAKKRIEPAVEVAKDEEFINSPAKLRGKRKAAGQDSPKPETESPEQPQEEELPKPVPESRRGRRVRFDSSIASPRTTRRHPLVQEEIVTKEEEIEEPSSKKKTGRMKAVTKKEETEATESPKKKRTANKAKKVESNEVEKEVEETKTVKSVRQRRKAPEPEEIEVEEVTETKNTTVTKKGETEEPEATESPKKRKTANKAKKVESSNQIEVENEVEETKIVKNVRQRRKALEAKEIEVEEVKETKNTRQRRNKKQIEETLAEDQKDDEIGEEIVPKKPKRGGKKVEKAEEPEKPATKRGKKVEAATEKEVVSERDNKDDTEEKPTTRRGAKRTKVLHETETVTVESPKKQRRGKKVEETPERIVKSPKTRLGRKQKRKE